MQLFPESPYILKKFPDFSRVSMTTQFLSRVSRLWKCESVIRSGRVFQLAKTYYKTRKKNTSVVKIGTKNWGSLRLKLNFLVLIKNPDASKKSNICNIKYQISMVHLIQNKPKLLDAQSITALYYQYTILENLDQLSFAF